MVDKKMICSSIAMLQERFRQLEKVKEMREERELLKLISYNNNNNHHHSSSPHSFDHSVFHSDIAFPNPKHYLQDSHDLLSLSLSLSLWQNPHMIRKKMKYDTCWDHEINSNTPQKLATKPSWLTKNINEVDDVDTTLHL